MRVETQHPQGIVAIPARLGSTRLANKLLLNETGKPLLAHVIGQAQAAVRQSSGLLTDVVVACDCKELWDVASACGARAVMTRADHRCGTTRITEAMENTSLWPPPDFVVNVQGDEPEIAPQAVIRVAELLLSDPAAAMATLVLAMSSGTENQKNNPNAVKAVLDGQGRAIYFSRAAIPFDRNPAPNGEALWYHHLGIYAYRRWFLPQFSALPTCGLEEREGLEQLRAIHAGYTIRAGVVPDDWAGKGIDTPEDYAAFAQRWRHQHQRRAA